MSTSPTPRALIPYAGLRPFRTDEDYLFFGREEQTAELVRLLREHRFLAVVGRSGSGKSSLVRAGLLPEIQGGMMQHSGSAWEIALLRPGGHPIRNLAESLVEADLYDRDDEEAVPRLLATLNYSALGLVESIRQSEIERGAHLLLVVDQFEELFRFERHDRRAQDEAHAFVELLLEASRHPEVSIYVVLTMRSDYLGDCAHVPGLAEAVNRGEYLIPRLDRNQLRAAIEGPAKVGGAAISYRLVQHLLNELGDEEDQLPILQHALMRTWSFWEHDHEDVEEVDLHHYEGTGGMQLAISNHADEVFESLPDGRHRKVAESLFRSLTVKGEDNRGVRRPTILGTLAAIAGEDLDVLRTVIDAYRRPGVTFLMPGEETALEDDTVIDLSHESLMRVWERLRRWVDDEALSARIYQRLRETAQLWQADKAGLYHDPDLSIAQTWREENQPTAAWADLYGGGFETAAEFLEQSQSAAAREEREREAARQRELAQAKALAESQAHTTSLLKRFAITVGVAAALAIGLAVWALRESKTAKQQSAIAEEQTGRAREAQAKAQASAARAQQAEGRTWLANARTMLEAKNSFGARLKAWRAIGFEGSGRDKLSEAQREAFPVLLKTGDPSSNEARELIDSSDDVALLWQSGSLPPHEGVINDLAASPDGKFYASISEPDDSAVLVWEAATGMLVATLEGGLTDCEVVAFSPDSRYLALAGDDQVTFWEIANGRFSQIPEGVIRAARPEQAVTLQESEESESAALASPPPDFRSMCFSPDGDTLVLGDHHGRLYAWKDWRSFADFPAHPVHDKLHSGRIVDLAYQPGTGALLATASRADRAIKLLDGKSFRVLDELSPGDSTARDGQTALVWSVSFSADGSLLAAGGDHLPVTVWNTADHRPVATLLREERSRLAADQVDGEKMEALGFRCRGLSFSAQGAQLAVVWHQTGKPAEPRWYRPTATLFDFAEGPGAVKRIRDLTLAAVPEHFLFDRSAKSLLVGLNWEPRLQLLDLDEDRGDRGLEHPERRIRDLRFSPDGTCFASGDEAGVIRIHEASTGALRHSIGAHIGRIGEICFSPDGRRLFSVGFQDKTLCAWDTTTGELLNSVGVGYVLVGLAITPEGDSVVVGGWKNFFRFYDPETLELQATRDAAHGNTMRLTPDGRQAVVYRNSEGSEPELAIYDRNSDGSLRDVMRFPAPMHSATMNNVALSPDGLTMAVGFSNGMVRTWTRQGDGTWDESVSLRMPGGAIEAWVQFDQSGERLVTGDNNGQVCIWSFSSSESAELVSTLPGPDGIASLALSPDGRLLVTGSRQGIIQMWGLSSDSKVHDQLAGIGTQDPPGWFARGAQGFALARGRRLLFTAGRQSDDNPNAIHAWHYRGRRLSPAFVLEGHARPVTDLAVSPDERYLVSVSFGDPNNGGEGGSIRLWDLETRDHKVLFDKGGLASVAFTPDSATVAVHLGPNPGDHNTPIQFWDVRKGGDPVAKTRNYTNMAFGLAFTPDGKQLIVAHQAESDSLRIYDFDPETRDFQPAHAIPTSAGRFMQIDVSPDGKFLMAPSTAEDKTKLWNLADRTPRGSVPRIDLGAWGFSSAISPDGSLVAVGGGNSKVVVAHTDGSGEIVARFAGPSQASSHYASQLKFDSDNRTLFMSFNDGHIIVWELSPQDRMGDPGRYLEVVDLEEASGRLQWKVQRDRLVHGDPSLAFANIAEHYLPFLADAASEEEGRLALFDYYLEEGHYRAAYSVALSIKPERARELWPRLSSALADALALAKARDESAGMGGIRHLALRVFEEHPPKLEVQLMLSVENSAWDKIATILEERLPDLPPDQRARHVKALFDGLDDYVQSLLEKTGSIAEGDPLVPPRDLLLAATLYRAAIEFEKAWKIDPWRTEAAFRDLPPAAQLLDRLEEGRRAILTPSGSTWKYYDRAGAPDAGWNKAGYDDRDWASGDSPLGYGSLQGAVKYGTRIDTFKTGDTGKLSYYFRQEIETPAGWKAATQQLTASLLRDDGVVLYLDGEEVLRLNLPDGEITPETTALATIGSADKEFRVDARLPAQAIQPGAHLLAAEIHQATPTSSDILFDLALYAPSPDTWRSPGGLEAAVTYLERVDAEHNFLPWLAALTDRAPQDSAHRASFHVALRAALLNEVGAIEEALAAIDARLARLQGSYNPVLVGERMRLLSSKAQILQKSGRPSEEVQRAIDASTAIPSRDPNLSARLIDLGNYYTSSLYRGSGTSAIPETFVPLKGVSYDLRGMIELNSGPLDNGKSVREIRGYDVPDKVEGIVIGQKTATVHFLLNAAWGQEAEKVEVGKLVLHYEDKSTAERPLIFGEDLADWAEAADRLALPREREGWRNPRPEGLAVLAELTWKNPHPDKTIAAIDFVSALKKAGPLLVAITLDE